MPVNEAQLEALEALGEKAKRLDKLKGSLEGVLQSFTDQMNHRDQLINEIATLEVEIERDYLAVKTVKNL